MKTISAAEIKTVGNNLGIRILKKVSDALKLHNGSQIKVLQDEKNIVLESESNLLFYFSKDTSLSSLFSKITSKNKHSSDEF